LVGNRSVNEIAAQLLGAGVRLLQYRHKGPFTRARWEECRAIAEMARQHGAQFLVNDRADVALLCGASGVHLGQQDLPPEAARQVETTFGTRVGAGLAPPGAQQAPALGNSLLVDKEQIRPGPGQAAPLPGANVRAGLRACPSVGVDVGAGPRARLVVGGRQSAVGEMIIGFSTHNAQQAREGDRLPVDYLAIGPVFPTRTKEQPDPVVGLETVAAVRAAVKKPLVAIGGIRLENARAVLDAGADVVAVGHDLLAAEDVAARARQFLRLVIH